MYSIHINPTGAEKFGCQPGRHLVDNVNAGELLTMGWGEDAILYEPPSWDWSASEAAPPQDVLFIRAGGAGDILMLTAVLQSFHDRYPDCAITVACMTAYAPMLVDLNFGKHIAYPIPIEIADHYATVVPLEDVIERETDPNIDAIDCLASAVGLDGSDLTQPLPVFRVSDEEVTAALARFPRAPKEKRLGIQQATSAECRTYPLALLQRVVVALLAEGWTVYRFGAPREFNLAEKTVPGFIDLTLAQPELSFRESAAVMITCDVMLTPDSSLVYIAGTLGIPTVALYGPFHWKQRVQRYRSVTAIQGQLHCAPCNHSERGGIRFPIDGPCFQTKHCHALATITPSRIVGKIKDARYSSRWLPGLPVTPAEGNPAEDQDSKLAPIPSCAPSE